MLVEIIASKESSFPLICDDAHDVGDLFNCVDESIMTIVNAVHEITMEAFH